MSQHGDDPDDLHRASYCRFLVESPLTHVSREQDPAAPACGYGSFHQQYWLDGESGRESADAPYGDRTVVRMGGVG